MTTNKKNNLPENLDEGCTTIKYNKKIEFNLDRSGLACFISKNNKQNKKNVRISQKQSNKQDLTKTIKNNINPHLKLSFKSLKKSNSFLNGQSYNFNNKLLFLNYDNQDVYVDSQQYIQKNKDKQKKIENQQHQQQIIKMCIKVITQQTNYSSSGYNQIDYQSYPCAYQYQNIFENKKVKYDSKIYIIDLPNIEVDGRTTLMVRNIPNKYTEEMLFQLFSQNHKKKFDFLYLPIDSKNKCNVGYAFVNFVHSKFIKEFYLQFNNKKWSKFNSEKICNICYARIQGTSELSNHFEYSKANNNKKYRPNINPTVLNNLSEIVYKQKQEI